MTWETPLTINLMLMNINNNKVDHSSKIVLDESLTFSFSVRTHLFEAFCSTAWALPSKIVKLRKKQWISN